MLKSLLEFFVAIAAIAKILLKTEVTLRTEEIFLLVRLRDDITLKISVIEWLSIFRRLPGVRLEVHLGDEFFVDLSQDGHPLHFWIPVWSVTLVLPLCYCSVHTSAGTFWIMISDVRLELNESFVTTPPTAAKVGFGRVQVGTKIKGSRTNYVLLDVFNSTISLAQRKCDTAAISVHCSFCRVNLFTSLVKATKAHTLVGLLLDMTRKVESKWKSDSCAQTLVKYYRQAVAFRGNGAGKGIVLLDMTVRETTVLTFPPSCKLKIPLFKMQNDSARDSQGQWRVPMIVLYVSDALEGGSWRRVASTRGESRGWGSRVQVSEIDLMMATLPTTPTPEPASLQPSKLSLFLLGLMVDVVTCPNVYLWTSLERATARVDDLSVEFRANLGGSDDVAETFSLQIYSSSIHSSNSIKITAVDPITRVTVQTVNGDREGFMGRVVSTAKVEVDGLVVTSPHAQVILDNCAFTFEERTGSFSIASAQLRLRGPVPLRTSARSVCIAMVVSSPGLNTSRKGLMKGLIHDLILCKGSACATVDALALTVDVKVLGPSALRILSRSLRWRPRVRGSGFELSDDGDGDETSDSVDNCVYDEYFDTTTACTLPARHRGLQQALTVDVTGSHISVTHSRTETLGLELAEVWAEVWTRLRPSTPASADSMHSFVVVEVRRDAAVCIIAKQKEAACSPLLRLSHTDEHILSPLLIVSSARYLPNDRAQETAFYRLRVEPLGHLTVVVDQAALISLLNTLKERCVAVVSTFGHIDRRGSHVPSEVAVVVQPFAVVVRLGGRMANPTSPPRYRGGNGKLVVPFPRAYLKSPKDIGFWVVKAFLSSSTTYSRGGEKRGRSERVRFSCVQNHSFCQDTPRM